MADTDCVSQLIARFAVTTPGEQLPESALHVVRLSMVGRMALTNYLTQTLMGLLVFAYLVDAADVSRTTVALFVVIVWILQLWWSTRWLARYTQGPIEWLWRCATYRRLLPLRRFLHDSWRGLSKKAYVKSANSHGSQGGGSARGSHKQITRERGQTG